MEQFSGDTEPWGVIGHSSTSTGHHEHAIISVSPQGAQKSSSYRKGPYLLTSIYIYIYIYIYIQLI